jgi:hypothetical protein
MTYTFKDFCHLMTLAGEESAGYRFSVAYADYIRSGVVWSLWLYHYRRV